MSAEWALPGVTGKPFPTAVPYGAKSESSALSWSQAWIVFMSLSDLL